MLKTLGRVLAQEMKSTLGGRLKAARWLIGAALVALLLATAPAALADSGNATVTGTVEDASTTMPIANVQVSASDTTGDSASAVTDSNGNFTLSLPPGTWTFTFTPSSSAYQSQTLGPDTLSAGENPGQGLILLQPNLGDLTGRVTDATGAALPGMQVQLAYANGADGPTGFTGADGHYAFTGLDAGTYSVSVLAGVSDTKNLQPVQVGSVTVSPSTTTSDTLVVRTPVPPGTVALNAARDLAWLNAERVSNGLPGGIVLNPRWAADCAAHDAYERANGGTLTHVEQLGNRGSSTGGWWDGTASVLAASVWAAGNNPFETAPLHLASLYAPSLSVVGIDDAHGYQCVNTLAGTQRTFASDTVFTYPGNGLHGVPPSENAAEMPFVPGQFVGIPQGRTAGRELFVYLNQAGQMGQAQVHFLSATLSGPHGLVAIKTVDNTTPTVGPYLSGGIIIPVKPLAPHTTYTARVTLTNGSGTISHTWSFTTGANPTRPGTTGAEHKHKRKPARHRKHKRH